MEKLIRAIFLLSAMMLTSISCELAGNAITFSQIKNPVEFIISLVGAFMLICFYEFGPKE